MERVITSEAKRKSPPSSDVTFEEFLEWGDENTWAEWLYGEIIMMVPPSDQHQNLVRFLLSLLNLYTEANDLSWLRSAPFLMRLSPTVAREPDLLFVTNEHMDRVREAYLDGPADLVIEIVSPDSIARDRGEKFVEYEVTGVTEYWLIDPLRQQAEFYQLGDDGHYRLVPPDSDGSYHSHVLTGFRMRPDWMWREPLPKVLDVARELDMFGNQ
jgi:Uma2 family endonuclease